MAAISDIDVLEKVQTRLSGMKVHRAPVERINESVARYEQLRFSRHMRRTAKDGTVSAGASNAATLKGWTNEKLYNDHPVRAWEIMRNGVSSGLCSPSQPWFSLRPEDPDMMEFGPVKEWLATVTALIYDLFSRCGFYSAATQGFGEQGLFGTEATLMIPHWEYGAACLPLEWGDYWIAQNDANRVDTLYRQCDMTVAQIYARFPQGKFSRALQTLHREGKYDTIVPIMHAIEPNLERIYGRMDRTNMAYRSIYWELNADKADGIISFGGFEERPFWAPRWDVAGSGVYGESPGMRAVSTARRLQHHELKKTQLMDYMARPPLAAPSNIPGGVLRTNPGDVTMFAPSDQQQVYALWRVEYQALQAMEGSIEKAERKIDATFYADLFKAFIGMDSSAYQNVQAIARKHEEQLTQLGPVVERAGNEKLDPAVTQAFNILQRSGALPPPPEELAGMAIKVRFDGVLAQAQRMIGLAAIERTASFTGNLLAAFPGTADKIDADQMIDEYASLAGAPPKMIRSDDDVAELRQSRQQAEQSQQALAAMPQVESGANAARLLSETDMGNGRSMLDALTGSPGV